MIYRIVPTDTGKRLIKSLKESKIPKPKKVKKIKDTRNLLSIYKYVKKHNKPDVKSIIIYDNDKEIFRFDGSIPKKKLNKITSRYKNATVMIELAADLYKKIPLSLYKKLSKIRFMQFTRSYELLSPEGTDTSQYSWYDIPTMTEYVLSIAQLLKLITFETEFDRTNEIFISAKFYILSVSNKECEILYTNGQIRKIKYSKFLKLYDLKTKNKPIKYKNKR